MTKFAIALAAVFALTVPAAAQHNHGNKGPNGGIMEDVAGVHAELLATGHTITVNILDESNKPIPVKGYVGSLLVISGTNKETIQLAPSGDSAMKGETKAAIVPNTQITLMIKTAAGKSGQARYKIAK